MLIDFHTHCFPNHLAERALEKLSHASGGLIPYTNGTVEGLRCSMRDNNVDISIVMNIATNAHQQTKVNDFAASIQNEKDIWAFGSVYPDSADAFGELERIRALGLKGVKFHPDYQGFSVDDARLKPLYRKISSLGLVTVFHAGLDYAFPPPYGATPEKLARALLWFDSPVVAAHWGGLNCGEEVLKYLCKTDVFFDTAFGYGSMPRYYAQRILDAHGVDKFLFGTDTPWHTVLMEKRLLNTLSLSEAEAENLYFGNACQLLSFAPNKNMKLKI